MQAVPLGFFLFLMELAAGGLLITVLLDWDRQVSAGFLFLNGLFLLGFAAAGIWLRTALPAARLVPYPVAGGLVQAEPAAWSAFALLSALYLVCVKREARGASRVVGALASAAGLVGLYVSAGAYRPPAVPALLMAASFVASALALGTVWGGMMLGHWYLVTPLLSPRPLLRLNAGLCVALVLEALVLIAAAVVSATSGPVAAASTWPFWLRGFVGVLFPLFLCLPVWRTARVRSMMSATGLLYIALGAILAGEILGRTLLFVTQTPV